MDKILLLKLWIYGLIILPIQSFIVEKRETIIDHNQNSSPINNDNDVTHENLIDKQLVETKNPIKKTLINQTPIITPKKVDDVSASITSLNDIEKKLEIYPENFIKHRDQIKQEIERNIKRNEYDLEKLEQKQKSFGNSVPTRTKNLVKWMQLKKNENNLYKQDLELLADVSSMVTKLEAAKYISMNNLYDNPSSSSANEIYSGTNTAAYPSYNPYYGTYTSTPSYNNYPTTNYYPQNSPYDQNKYNLFNQVYQKQLDTYNNMYYQNGGTIANKRFMYNTPTPVNSPYIYNTYNGYNPWSYGPYYSTSTTESSSASLIDSPSSTKSYIDDVNNNRISKKISTADTAKAVNAINYLQDKLGLDSSSILNLMSQLKESAKNEMLNKKDKFQRQLLNYKRSTINGAPDVSSKRSEILSNQNDFIRSRDRFWLIKEVEWFVTRLEAAKYAALSHIQ